MSRIEIIEQNEWLDALEEAEEVSAEKDRARAEAERRKTGSP